MARDFQIWLPTRLGVIVQGPFWGQNKPLQATLRHLKSVTLSHLGLASELGPTSAQQGALDSDT